MILFCEECGSRNELVLESDESSPGYILCQVCGDVIKIMISQLMTSILKVTFRDQTIEMNDHKPVITIGRKQENDLVVPRKNVSRSHAVIDRPRMARFDL